MGFGAPRSKLYEKTLLFPCNVTKQNFILIMIMCKGKLQTYLGMCGYVTICVRKYVFRLDTVCCLVGDFIFGLVGRYITFLSKFGFAIKKYSMD